VPSKHNIKIEAKKNVMGIIAPSSYLGGRAAIIMMGTIKFLRIDVNPNATISSIR